MANFQFLQMVPVLPTADMARDLAWYHQYVGFQKRFGDEMYTGIGRDNLEMHLQWHADNADDPLLGGSVVRIFVADIHPIFEDLVERGTVPREKLRMNTPWGTHEVGFFDLNKNAIFFVQDV